MRLPGAAGTAGATGATTVEVTVGDAVVVTTLVVTASCGTDDAVGVAVFATVTERFEAVTLIAGGSVAEDLCATGAGAVDEGVESVVVLLVDVLWLVAVVGSVMVVPVPVTVVFAPPEACTTGVWRSVVDCVEVVDASVDDEPVAVLVGSVLEAVDVESLADVLVEESVADEPVVSASAIAGLLAIDTPSPSATASAPTRPT